MTTKTLIALILLVFCLAPATIAQRSNTPITGEWRIEFTRKDTDEVQLNMSLGKQQNWGDGIKISELQGLSREAQNSPMDVTIRIVRDAGTFELVGSFRDGKGSGRFTLTPDQSFFSALATRGYTNLSDNNVFSAAMANLKIASIDALKASGYDKLTFDNLVESSIFQITPETIADLRSAGFDHLAFSQLIEAHIFKVDGIFAQQAENLGFGKLPFNKLVELRVHKITPEYMSEIQQLGFKDLNLDRVVEFKIFQVTAQFVNDLRAAGFTSVTPQELVNLRVFKIDMDFVRRAKSEDPNITIQGLVDMRIHEKRASRGIQ
ncbi:MAG TPA: hypothetical protein DC054_22465 [Blastocatellia bacterium]|nr:hypothetical protein [Blastocatellia bacterium]